MKAKRAGSDDVSASSIELASLDVDAVFLYGHTQILHRQDGLSLATPALAAATVATPLDAQLRGLLRLARPSSSRGAGSSNGAGTGQRGGAQGVVASRRVGRADATVLVGVGRDIGDELLGRQREQTGEGQRRRVGAGAAGIGRRRRR
jgi:hypothetical protein